LNWWTWVIGGAILFGAELAFVDAQHIDVPSPITSVPTAPRHADVLGGPVCCDNFA